MADNITLNTGSGGATLAADDIASVWHQRVKIQYGVDGAATDVSDTNPLPIDDAGGSLTVDATALDIRALTSGDVVTANLSATDNAVLDSIDAAVNGTLTVGSHAVTNAGTFAVQASSVTPGTAAANLGKAEDAAHTNGDVGVMALAVRNDTAGTLAGTNGDYAPLQVNSSGFLRVKTEMSAAAALGDAVANPTTTGVGAFSMLWNGSTWSRVPGSSTDGLTVNLGSNNDVTVTGTVTVDGSAVTQPVSGTVTANAGTGTFTVDNAGTFAVQVDAALPAGTNAIGKLAANSGVDIGDVDVLSAPARDRTTDNVGVAVDTDTVMQDTTARTVAFGSISAASSGDNTLLAAQGAGNKIRVLSYVLVAAGAVNVRFESGAGGTALTGVMSLTTNSGISSGYSPVGHFETAANALLNLELSAAVQVSGHYTYVVVT